MPQENSSSTIHSNPQESPGIEIEFVQDEANKKLTAVLTQSDAECDFDLKSLRAKLESDGFDHTKIEDSVLCALLHRARRGQVGRVAIEDISPQIGLTFDYDVGSRTLFAVLSESHMTHDITFASVKNRLQSEGYGNYVIKNQAISDVVLKAQQQKTGRFPVGLKPEFTQIRYKLDESNGNLTAELSASEDEVLISPTSILDNLKASGYDSFFFEPNALDKIYNLACKAERGQFTIGRKRDAQVDIEFDEEFMHAYISISPPQGGRDLDEYLLHCALSDAGINDACCDKAVIDKVLREKSATHLEFARGSEPIDGIDATFEPLVQEVEFTTPKETKSEKIDLREISSFTLVEENTPLMKRVPAKPGTNGRNVKGQIIPAVDAIDTPFDEELEGTRISEEDPNLLLANCKGHPVILDSGVRVDNILVVNNVDMNTGNITYDGSLLVKGEVKPGMKINVTGDIVVKGVVSKASLRARNNITVECGIIGSDTVKEGEASPPSVIKAGGNIRAQYINLAEVNAGRNVEVREYISHCTTNAKHQVLVGQEGGKGRIFGGSCYGRSGIYSNSLGASGSIKTMVSTGTPPDQQKQLEQLIQGYENRKTQSNQLSGILQKYKQAMKQNPEDIGKVKKAQAVKKVLFDIDKEIEKMSATIKRINLIFKSSKNAQISIRKSTFPNVDISINGAEFHIRQESKGGIFVKQDQDIRWNNYKAS